MSFSNNKRLKKLYVLKILLENTDEDNMMSTRDLIEALKYYGISAERKSIYTDIEDLKEFGIDVICEKNSSNYYYIGARDFELAELKLLVDVIQSSKFITKRKSQELKKKLQDLTSIHKARELQRNITVHNRVKAINEQIYYNIDLIHRGIQENKYIEFKYYSYDENKRFKPRRNGEIYKVIPYSLNWADEKYYLIGYHQRYNDLSNFRVDRMKELSLSCDKFNKDKFHKEFNVVDYANKTFEMFIGDTEKVEIEFNNSMMNIVIDKFGEGIKINRAKEGYFNIVVDIQVSNTFYSWLFIFGEDAKILSPLGVREEFKRYLERVRRIYD